MEKVEYPQKVCREPVWSETDQAYSCELPLLHRGPCASYSIRSSVAHRDAWEINHPDDIGKSIDPTLWA